MHPLQSHQVPLVDKQERISPLWTVFGKYSGVGIDYNRLMSVIDRVVVPFINITISEVKSDTL